MGSKLIAVAIMCIALVGCGDSQPELVKDQLLNGEVSYRARILTPPGSMLEITLEDDNGTQVGQLIQEVQGAPPFAFELPYANSENLFIDIKLRIDGEVKFSASSQPVDTNQTEFWL